MVRREQHRCSPSPGDARDRVAVFMRKNEAWKLYGDFEEALYASL